MKQTKFSLFALATIVCSGNTFAASDMDVIPYLEASANTYIQPYLSRDLGKEVKITADPYKPELKLVIPNASCDDYLSSMVRLMKLYPGEFVLDRLEEDESLTIEQLYEPMKKGTLFELASGLLVKDISSNPMVIASCNFKKGPSDPEVIKKVKQDDEKLKLRADKLKQAGRLKG
ncbi:hypothetical protein BMT54_07395 [Pasteurellaceae bacterium 15-036681]|nr:hypothetical protein BMT54_07395 [Pasteurellaceae bacterium 15-036681]